MNKIEFEITLTVQQRAELLNELLTEKIPEWKCKNNITKRPENGFIIFRKRAQQWFGKNNIPVNMKPLSKLVGQIWKDNIPEETKSWYKSMSEIYHQQKINFK